MLLWLALAAATPPAARPERQALAMVRIVRPATVRHGQHGAAEGQRVAVRETLLRTAGGTQPARLIEFP